ncbi:hypothetical protein F53441_782 [Fusarium austroafricanum]|uniref:Uncharacterized protein n=1 Tax=Fusarium austroafricanum TaxID=2364996 RepID=A0A8H4P4R3_9HYPO|nr:hypothetical protein F53441_782 [Fusarium austroafricanum]
MPTDIATRALVVTLRAPSGAAKTTAEIHALTGISVLTINDIYARAIRRVFEPNKYIPYALSALWLEDVPRSGRPSKRMEENQDLIIIKLSGGRDLNDDNSENSAEDSRIQKDEANEEAWTDEEDVEGTPLETCFLQ